MNQQLRDNIVTCRAMYVEAMARLNDMLSRCDRVEACSEVDEIRAEILAMARQIEGMNYWIGCLEALEWMGHGRKHLH